MLRATGQLAQNLGNWPMKVLGKAFSFFLLHELLDVAAQIIGSFSSR
jgi:hypothetical protein